MTTKKGFSGGLADFFPKKAKKEGIVFVISGPSGSGKTTLCGRLLRHRLGLINSVSVTTRRPRKGERKNIDYIYVSEEAFKKDIGNKKFLEYAEVFGSYYGTLKSGVLDALKKGRDVLLSVDVQGAAQVKKIFNEKAALIFLLPPTIKDLKERLSKRSSDSPAQISERLRIAHNELRALDIYDYVVINDDIKKATDRLVAIITAARCRRKRS